MGAEQLQEYMNKPMTQKEAGAELDDVFLKPKEAKKEMSNAEALEAARQREAEMVIARQEVAKAIEANRRERVERQKERFVGVLSEQGKMTG
jgi:hypothetical protein